MKIEELRLNIGKNIEMQLSLIKDVYPLAIADKTQVNKINIWANQLTALVNAYHKCCEQEIIELEKLMEDIITDHIFAIQMQKDQNSNEYIIEDRSHDSGQFSVKPSVSDDGNK